MPRTTNFISISSGIEFEIDFFNYKPNINLDVTFELKSIDDVTIFHHGALITRSSDSKKGLYKVKGTIPSHLLNSGVYLFNLIFGENQRYPLFTIQEFVQFEVLNEMFGTNSSVLPGLIRPDLAYEITNP